MTRRKTMRERLVEAEAEIERLRRAKPSDGGEGLEIKERDPHELGWRRDIVGQTGEPSGRTWIKPDGTYYTFAPGVRMVVFEAPDPATLWDQKAD
jgi:hypothetical protein